MSSNDFQKLAALEYPGRVLMFGRDITAKYNVIGYALTGRSPSSRARVLRRNEDGSFCTDVTDPELLQKGNPKLLLYNCVFRHHEQLMVSNGMQTDAILEAAVSSRLQSGGTTPLQVLTEAFSRPHWVDGNAAGEYIDITGYEPDAPTYTPRISGVMDRDRAAMTIVKRVQDDANVSSGAMGDAQYRAFFDIPLRAGKGAILSTYQGQNVPSGQSIPSFVGEPLEVGLTGSSPREVAEAMYAALGPKEAGEGILSPGQDFRVAVLVLFYHRDARKITHHIINRHEL